MKIYYKKKILITGASGFIGKNVLEILGKKYDFYYLNRENLNQLIQNRKFQYNHIKFDCILHCAAVISVPDKNISSYEYYNFNINSSLALASLCIDMKIKKFIYLNTYGYGNFVKNPIDETNKLSPLTSYAKSKYLAEKLLFEFLFKEINVISFRIFNLFGKYQNPFFLIPSIIDQAIKGNDVYVNNSETKRDYLYILDLINLLDKAFDISNIKGIYNVGSGKSYGAEEILYFLSKIMNKKLNLISKNISRKADIFDCYANIQKAKNDFGWNLNYSLFDGLTNLLNLIKNNEK